MTARIPPRALDPESLAVGEYVAKVEDVGGVRRIVLVSASAHAHAAANVTYAGSTNLSATNVEAALDELDAEKAATVHTHFRSEITDAGTAIRFNVPVSGDAAAGEVVLGSDTRLGTRSRARAYSSGTATSVPSATNTIIPLPSEAYDTDNLHDNVTNNSRITLNKAGVWMVVGRIGYTGNSTGRRFASVLRNGVAEVAGLTYPTNTTVAYTLVSGFVVAAVGDYLQLEAYQDSGVALNAENPSPGATFLAAVHLGA